MISSICKDCFKEWQAHPTEPGQKVPAARPAPYPGPRCATHHRENRRAARERAHAAMVQRTYNLKPGDYEKLYQAQGGHCAICERATGATRKLSVDHDHETGEVRGLLCRPCNNMLGHSRDDWHMFARATRYLVCPPAREILKR